MQVGKLKQTWGGNGCQASGMTSTSALYGRIPEHRPTRLEDNGQ